MQTITVGPAQGTLLLHTGVEGRAARMGHALTIAVTSWECRTELDGDTPVSVELGAELGSLEILTGEGGLKPLSDKDRKDIRKNALKTVQAQLHPQVAFRSTAVRRSQQGWSLLGELTLHGVSRPLAVEVALNGDGRHITATTAVLQSDHGITPYSGMLGALQVSDRVQVRVEVALPAR